MCIVSLFLNTGYALMRISHCTLYSFHCTQYIVHCTPYSVLYHDYCAVQRVILMLSIAEITHRVHGSFHTKYKSYQTSRKCTNYTNHTNY